MADGVQINKNPQEVWVRYPSPGKPDDSSGKFNLNGGIVLIIVIILIILLVNHKGDFAIGKAGMFLGPAAGSIPGLGGKSKTVTGYKYVVADRLNVREEPTEYAKVICILSEGSRVKLLGETHLENDGGSWLKVNAETSTGGHIGWVDQRYVE
jgi:Bacterial SH3 domain